MMNKDNSYTLSIYSSDIKQAADPALRNKAILIMIDLPILVCNFPISNDVKKNITVYELIMNELVNYT